MAIEIKTDTGPLTLGDIVLGGRAVLAPLSGVTDLHMRRVAARFGAAMVISEMVASDAFVRGAEEARLRAESSGLFPHNVQLAGCDPYWLGEAARLAEANGADIIDINMGCPAKRVTGGWAGSALMRDLDHASRLIEAVVQAVDRPVTVKMRLGWDHANLNAPALAARAEALGAAAVTVHGRTRQQFYKGRADWQAIRAVRDAVRIPVLANGDIASAADARACLAASGADAVMIGRAATGRPWLVGDIARNLGGEPPREITPEEKTQAMIEHYDGLLDLYGSRVGLRHARKHLAAYAEVAESEGYAVTPSDRRHLVTSEDPEAVRAGLAALYAGPRRRVSLEDAA